MLFEMRNYLWLGLIAAMVMLYASLAVAQLPTTVDEASVSATYNDVAGNAGWGVIVAVPYEFSGLKGHAASIAQKGGNVYRNKYHAEIGVGLSNFDVNVYTNGLIKKYDGAEAGRVSGLGLAVEAPEQALGEFQVTGGLGIEGQNGGQIGQPNAGDTLEALGYDAEVLDGLGLYGLTPAPTGLSLVQGNAFKGVLYAELAHPSGLTINIKALPDIASASEYPAHQLIVSGSTSFELSDMFSLDVGIDVGLQTSPVVDGEIERETALFVGGKYTF